MNDYSMLLHLAPGGRHIFTSVSVNGVQIKIIVKLSMSKGFNLYYNPSYFRIFEDFLHVSLKLIIVNKKLNLQV